ncbi:MAG: hypothetical protein E7609_01415 [Ruminococcaceae bacterium]|nr:hypothetical protein [Oscillospiraceae bacterium]
MSKANAKKIITLTGNVLLYLFLGMCVLAVFFTLLGNRDADGALRLFGRELRLVTTDSMAACEQTDVSGYEVGSIPRLSLIVVETVPEDPKAAQAFYDALRVGDVLTFRYVYTSQVTITHRLVQKTPKDTGGYVLTLVGDNKNADTELLTQTIDTAKTNTMNYVIGKVTGSSYLLGVLLSILRRPIGIVLVIIVPCFIIILLEVFKIIGVVTAEKKKREQEEKIAKENELAELRRKLALLEAGSENTDGASSDEREVEK